MVCGTTRADSFFGDASPVADRGHQALRQHSSVSLRCGGGRLGAAERYVREIQTETPPVHPILVEVSAAGGSFCISFMQMFAEDNYLNAFLNELSQQGID